jgi:hypothetical protein
MLENGQHHLHTGEDEKTDWQPAGFTFLKGQWYGILLEILAFINLLR